MMYDRVSSHAQRSHWRASFIQTRMSRAGSVLLALSWIVNAEATQPFAIHVIDEATGRGVPLIELRITPDQTYLTDSNGFVAIDDPVLMGREVFFHVRGHGYEHAKDGFGYGGQSFKVTSGSEVQIKIQRLNIAERLYGLRIRTNDLMLNGSTDQNGLLQEIYDRKYLRFGTSGVRGRWQLDARP